MKGPISSVKGQKVAGTLTITKPHPSDEKDMELRLKREFPDYDVKVFSGIINNLIKDNALQLSRSDLIKACQKYLYEVVSYCRPMSSITEDTSLHSLVTIMSEYLTRRFGQVVAYNITQNNNSSGYVSTFQTPLSIKR